MLDHLGSEVDDDYDPTAGNKLKVTPYNELMWYTGKYGNASDRKMLSEATEAAAVAAKKVTQNKHVFPIPPPQPPPKQSLPKPVITAQPQSAASSPILSPAEGAGGHSARLSRPERWSLYSDNSSTPHSGNSSSANSSAVSPVITPANVARAKPRFAFTESNCGANSIARASADSKIAARRFSQPLPPRGSRHPGSIKNVTDAAAVSPLLLGQRHHQLSHLDGQALPPAAMIGVFNTSQQVKAALNNAAKSPKILSETEIDDLEVGTQFVEDNITVEDFLDIRGAAAPKPVSPKANRSAPVDDIEVIDDPLTKFQAALK